MAPTPAEEVLGSARRCRASLLSDRGRRRSSYSPTSGSAGHCRPAAPCSSTSDGSRNITSSAARAVAVDTDLDAAASSWPPHAAPGAGARWKAGPGRDRAAKVHCTTKAAADDQQVLARVGDLVALAVVRLEEVHPRRGGRRGARRASRRASWSARSWSRTAPSSPRPTARGASRRAPRSRARTSRRAAPHALLIAPVERAARRRRRLERRHHAEHAPHAARRASSSPAPRPPGASRASSRAVASWSGANIIPQVEETASKPRRETRAARSRRSGSRSRARARPRGPAPSRSGGREVDAGDDRAALRRALGHRSGAACDVEPAYARRGASRSMIRSWTSAIVSVTRW